MTIIDNNSIPASEIDNSGMLDFCLSAYEVLKNECLVDGIKFVGDCCIFTSGDLEYKVTEQALKGAGDANAFLGSVIGFFKGR